MSGGAAAGRGGRLFTSGPAACHLAAPPGPGSGERAAGFGCGPGVRKFGGLGGGGSVRMRSVGVLSCGAGGSVVGVACGESWWGAGGVGAL